MRYKVLFILHYPPPIHGSAVIGGYIKESRLISDHFKCLYLNLSTSVSVEDIGRNSLKKLIRYLTLIWQVKKQLLISKPQLCYFTPTAQGIGFYKDALIITLVKLSGIKVVFHYHNKGITARQNHNLDNLLYRIVFRNSFVILLSKHLYSDIKKYVPESRIYYCPNGIPDTEVKKQKSQQKSKLVSNSDNRAQFEEKDNAGTLAPNQITTTKTKVEILFLSHLIESKGVFILLYALKILHDKGISFHCTMIGGEGDISENQMKQKIAEARLAENVILAGKKYGNEKQEAFEKADIFVLPTFYHNECMPLVLIEAMQHSLPIVSTYEGAIPEVVEDGVNGFLVPQRDYSLLADKLEVLIKKPDLRLNMGSAGRAKYEAQFTLERFESRMVDILNQVAETNTFGN